MIELSRPLDEGTFLISKVKSDQGKSFFSLSFIVEIDEWEDDSTFGTREFSRFPKVVGTITGFDVTVWLIVAARQIKFDLWQKILNEFPSAKLKSPAAVRWLVFLDSEGHKGNQTIYLDIRRVLRIFVVDGLKVNLLLGSLLFGTSIISLIQVLT